ncbi:MAG: DUF1028 domain-containing protein [Planctomycetota bacterium]|nr:DUF1028 domain-containing protein [Planctomycetota bacterium]
MPSLRIITTLVLAALSVCFLAAPAQATFSIVAVDPATGEVGGAGAMCIDNAMIINELIEGIGAIHTQAYYRAVNQNNARSRMLAGDSPQQIIIWLVDNDANGVGCPPSWNCNETHRQYGVVDIWGTGGRSAAYTGASNAPYADHIEGPTYAIQGNSLLDPATYDVLGEMEAAFLSTTGPLADRLMAALQAANWPGADGRCLPSGKPAISSFIKVVRMGDGANPYLELEVPTTTASENPIDKLQGLFDAWKIDLDGEADPFLSSVSVAQWSLPADGFSTTQITVIPRNNSGADLGFGRIVNVTHSGNGTLGPVVDTGLGSYTATLTAPGYVSSDTITATVDGSGGLVTLSDQPSVQYVAVPPPPPVGGSGGYGTPGACCCSLGPVDPLSAWGAMLPFIAVFSLLILMRLRAFPAFQACRA